MAVQGCVVGDSQHLAGHGRDRSVAMTLRQFPADDPPQRTTPEHTPRLRLKPKAPRSGFVDGAWWPRSDDLNAELPDLLAVLSVRLGPIDRVMFNVNEWVKPTPKLFAGGRAVRLDGHQRQPVSTVEVIGLDDGSNRPAGSAAELRTGWGTRGLDGCGGPERRVNCRRSACEHRSIATSTAAAGGSTQSWM